MKKQEEIQRKINQQDEVRELIRAYGELGEEGLWANIEYFLKRVIPVAEECDVVMALHPDDPPG